MKSLITRTMVVAMVCLAFSVSHAANRVAVESKTVGTGTTDVPVYVHLDNDVELTAVLVPLVIREVTPGAFISSIQMRWAGRLPSGPSMPLSNARINNIYPDPDGTCGPAGFATFAYNDTLKHAIVASPEGVLFLALTFTPAGNLPPGSDVTGSLILTTDIGNTPGTLEIDTACTDPMNHLLFVDHNSNYITPEFVKGTLTLVANDPPVAVCANVTVSAASGCAANASIDAGSFDPDGDPLTITQTPPPPYPLGVTTVRLDVYDDKSAHDWCEATVTVIDDTPPILSCPGDILEVIPEGETGAVVEFTPSATDECPGVTVVSSPPSGSYFPVGISTVTCVATDGAGNTSECTFFVSVTPGAGYCNDRPFDVNCDGVITPIDLNDLIEVLFFGVPEPGPCCQSGP